VWCGISSTRKAASEARPRHSPLGRTSRAVPQHINTSAVIPVESSATFTTARFVERTH
jgi:hypothetical protein